MKRASILLMLTMVVIGIGMHPPPAHAVEFEVIRANLNRMTSVEWHAYAKSLEGQRVSWTGRVHDVQEKWFLGFYVFVEMEAGGGTDVSLQDVPEALAKSLRKGQVVHFSGRIDSVWTVLGSLDVFLREVSVTAVGPKSSVEN